MSILNNVQFQYDTPDLGTSSTIHRVRAMSQHGMEVGSLLWDSKQIRNVGVPEQHQRQGVATALWEEGHRMAGENARIPQPKHSADRTNAGDAWARSVGGKLPRRKQ